MICKNCPDTIISYTHSELTGSWSFEGRVIEPITTRPVRVWTHVRTGHERCEGKDTLAEPPE